MFARLLRPNVVSSTKRKFSTQTQNQTKYEYDWHFIADMVLLLGFGAYAFRKIQMDSEKKIILTSLSDKVSPKQKAEAEVIKEFFLPPAYRQELKWLEKLKIKNLLNTLIDFFKDLENYFAALNTANSANYFNQASFIAKVSAHYPHLAQHREKGASYGFTVLWFIYLSQGKDLLQDLQEIEHNINRDQPLSQHQLNLLQDIALIQANQHTDLHIYADASLKMRFKREKNDFIFSEDNIKQLKLSPYQLTTISLFRHKPKPVQHCIGLATFSLPHTKFFDANDFEITFKDEETAKNHSAQSATFYSKWLDLTPRRVETMDIQCRRYGLFYQPCHPSNELSSPRRRGSIQ